MTVKSLSRFIFNFGFLALAACGSSAQPTPVVPKPNVSPDTSANAHSAAKATALTPPTLKLPAVAKPIRYEVELALDPSREDFSGTIAIELKLDSAVETLWLNGNEIAVQEATLVTGGDRVPVKVSAAKRDYLAFQFPRAIGPGAATLHVKYTGKMHRDDGDGIYPLKEGDAYYLFTQFQATDARSAFPCFDEPGYKVPWQLTLRAPEGNQIVANTLPESEAKDGQGWKSVRFAETKPLPSYLIAFAVGPFDLVDAGKSRTGVPIRIVTPQGQGHLAGHAVQTTGELLDRVEDYFGTPYPYDKLDIVAVPVFNAGAMENAGLITFKQDIVVVKPGELTEARQQRWATVAAHELAHQWFGDLVTLAWWDDTWLNEAFASWIEQKVVEKWRPQWEHDVAAVASRAGAMSADSLASARKVRQPIDTADDINNAFDSITYDKGQAVLHMFEQWLGEATMQKGVRAYMAKYAFGSASYEEFIASLSEAAGKPLKPMWSSFVEQVGVPLVSFELVCNQGAPRLVLTQKRYLPAGSKGDAGVIWQVPVCVKYGTGKTVARACTVLDAASGELPLTGAKSCPDWVYPNADGNGYYRSAPGAELAARLARHADKLSTRERVNLVSDLQALVSAELLPVGDALTLVAKFARDKSRHLVGQSLGIAKEIEDLVPDELRKNYARFIQKSYGARARQLGWAPVAGETDAVRELRPKIVELVALSGADAGLVAEANKLAWKWLADRKAVDATMIEVVLRVAASKNDRKLWERLHAEAAKTTDRQERTRLLMAMADFDDPEIVKANHAVVLAREFELRDSFELMGTGLSARRAGGYQPSRSKRVRQMAWDFVKVNWDTIVEQLPRPYHAYLAYVPISLCSDEAKADLEAFFKDRAAQLEGGPRLFAQAAEQMSLCVENKKRKTPGVVAFLKQQ